MELSKTDAKNAIEKRLTAVKDKLDALDKFTTKAAQLEAEIAKLKSDEVAILKDETRDDDAKLPDFLPLRGSIELKQAAIARLPGKIDAAKEDVAKAGETAARILSAYHAAVKAAFRSMIETTTSGFINEWDFEDLMGIARRHPNVIQLHAFAVPVFAKDHKRVMKTPSVTCKCCR